MKKARVQTRQENAMRACGYCRCSTSDQVSGFGLDAQERAIRSFAESQGYQLVDVIREEGVSGAKKPDTRPGFRRVMQLVESGQVGMLLVYKFDRLSRSLVDAVNTTNRLLQEYGVVLRSVVEPIDTATSLGQTLFAIFAGMAEMEREAIVERTLGGRKEKALEGGWIGGVAPYGYRRDDQAGLVVEPMEAEAVRRIFAMKRSRASLRKIANALNNEGFPTRRGGRWHPYTISTILDNAAVYRGKLQVYFGWKGNDLLVEQDGKHQAIL